MKSVYESEIRIDKENLQVDNEGSSKLMDYKEKLVKFKEDVECYGYRLKNNKLTPDDYEKLLEKAVVNINTLINQRKKQEIEVFENWKKNNSEEYRAILREQEEQERREREEYERQRREEMEDRKLRIEEEKLEELRKINEKLNKNNI